MTIDSRFRENEPAPITFMTYCKNGKAPPLPHVVSLILQCLHDQVSQVGQKVTVCVSGDAASSGYCD